MKHNESRLQPNDSVFCAHRKLGPSEIIAQGRAFWTCWFYVSNLPTHPQVNQSHGLNTQEDNGIRQTTFHRSHCLLVCTQSDQYKHQPLNQGPPNPPLLTTFAFITLFESYRMCHPHHQIIITTAVFDLLGFPSFCSLASTEAFLLPFLLLSKHMVLSQYPSQFWVKLEIYKSLISTL